MLHLYLVASAQNTYNRVSTAMIMKRQIIFLIFHVLFFSFWSQCRAEEEPNKESPIAAGCNTFSPFGGAGGSNGNDNGDDDTSFSNVWNELAERAKNSLSQENIYQMLDYLTMAGAKAASAFQSSGTMGTVLPDAAAYLQATWQETTTYSESILTKWWSGTYWKSDPIVQKFAQAALHAAGSHVYGKITGMALRNVLEYFEGGGERHQNHDKVLDLLNAVDKAQSNYERLYHRWVELDELAHQFPNGHADRDRKLGYAQEARSMVDNAKRHLEQVQQQWKRAAESSSLSTSSSSSFSSSTG